MIRAIIIEDELAAQSLLSKILAKYCPDVKLLGYSDNAIDGLNLINIEKPDLVFMDIELNNSDSFEILDKIEDRNFKIIFTTAYNDHSLRAFEYEAVHYILKPYQILEVIESVRRVKNIIQKQKPYSSLIEKSKKIQALDNSKITVSTKEGFTVVAYDEIVRMEADRSYCYIYLKDNDRLIISKPLKSFDDTLPKKLFFRTHNSHLINLKYVKQYRKEDGGEIIMKDGSTIPLARRRKSLFLEML